MSTARMNGTNVQRDARRRPHPQFSVDVDTTANATTIAPHGELDALSAPVFGAVLDAVASRGARLVVIDLSDIRFCNIAALRSMTELAAQLHAVHGRVRLFAPAVLDRMLELADLRSMFDLDDPRVVAGAAGAHTTTTRLPSAPRSLRPRTSSPHRLATGT